MPALRAGGIDMAGRKLDEHDWNSLAALSLRHAPEVPSEVFRIVDEALSLLRTLNLCPKYLKDLRESLIRDALGHHPLPNPASVYLLWFGKGEIARAVKVGISKEVGARAKHIRTSNPYDLLWVHTAFLESRADALKVERAILEHFTHSRAQGEWFEVPNTDRYAAEGMSRECSDIASTVLMRPVAFEIQGW